MHPFSAEAFATHLPNLINYSLRLPDKRDFCQNQNLMCFTSRAMLCIKIFSLSPFNIGAVGYGKHRIRALIELDVTRAC